MNCRLFEPRNSTPIPRQGSTDFRHLLARKRPLSIWQGTCRNSDHTGATWSGCPTGGWAGRATQGVRKGYNLIEILVAVAMLFIMTLVGVPIFTAMMQNSRLDAATRQIAGDIRDARAKATLTGWQYRLLGFNVGGGQPYKNQYRTLGRSSTAVAWPADTSGVFESATQMAGPWVNFNQLYPGISLNPANSNPRFYVSFDSQGVAFEWDPSMNPLSITQQSGASRTVSFTSAGSVRIQ